MKKLEWVLFIAAEVLLFGAGRWKFGDEYLWFSVLSMALIGVNLFHCWYRLRLAEKV